MSEKGMQKKGGRFRRVAGKDGELRVIKIQTTESGDRSAIIYKKVAMKSFKGKTTRLTSDLSSGHNASPVLSNSGDKKKPTELPTNPNRRPTRINADRSLSRMKARDRELVGREY